MSGEEIRKLFEQLDEVTTKLIQETMKRYQPTGDTKIFSYERFVSIDPDGKEHMAEFVNGRLRRTTNSQRSADVEYITNLKKGEFRVLVHGPSEPEENYDIKPVGRGRLLVSTKMGYRKEVNFPPTYFEMKKKISNGVVEIIFS